MRSVSRLWKKANMAYSEQFNNLLRDIAYDSSDLSSAYSDGYTPQRRIESIYDY